MKTLRHSVFPVLVFLFLHQGAFAQEAVTAGPGSAKLGVLFQPWFVSDDTASARSTFRFRRIELKVTGSVQANSRWFLMLDPTKNISSGAVDPQKDNKILQDAGVAFSFGENWEITLGQFKLPSAFESSVSSSELSLPERSLLARIFGERRDMGLQIGYGNDFVKALVMVSNGKNDSGNSTNVNNSNNTMDLSSRADFLLFEKTLKAGIFAGYGEMTSSTTRELRRAGGANLHFSWNAFEIGIESAYERKNDDPLTAWTGELAFAFNEQTSAQLRYDTVNTINPEAFVGSASTIGLSHFISGHNLKAMMSYSVLKKMSGNLGTYTLDPGQDGSVFVLMLQAQM